MENEHEQFISIFKDAVDQVPDEYFSTVYYNMQNIKGLLKNRGAFRDSEFHRHCERIFCYELYHQLRILVDDLKQRQPNFLDGAFLQGELQKMQIIEFNQKLGLEDLSAEHIPDFLVHTPGSELRQVAIIEVKATPFLNFNSLFEDIHKIAEFIERYRYEFGLFLAVNINPDRVVDIIQTHSEQFMQFGLFIERIFVVVKEASNEQTFCKPLAELIITT
jgi:hypothetical protein